MSTKKKNRDSITIPITINKYKHQRLYQYLQRVRQGQKSFAMRELMEAGMETKHRYEFVDKLLEKEYVEEENSYPSYDNDIEETIAETHSEIKKKKEVPASSDSRSIDIMKGVKIYQR